MDLVLVEVQEDIEIKKKINKVNIEKKQAELKVLKEQRKVEKAKKELINDIKNDLKTEVKKDKLLKKYIKSNKSMKKSMYKQCNSGFSISKACFIVCFLLISYSLCNSYIINNSQAPAWVIEINSKFEAIKSIIFN
ncbi:hypothetical protein D4A35_17830 (plasmid) [Paraclostridium bifermentans]|uniref:Uncharacterized protein n=1 Tax=Paraclostridium bifermentans TaxID=1490 RepID=A0A5P3XK95_PARBF|nr:hypothetical protein D4A35_17830 [Paraclostridium bifermentans]